MKGTISPEMRALMKNKKLFEMFMEKLFSNTQRVPFTITDPETGDMVSYSPYGHTKPKKKRNLLQLLLGL
jgi:hypothetical protein